jgi:zinc transporter, ZIP family
LSWSPVLVGFLASLAAGLMTGVGALPVLFTRELPQRVEDALLGFAAGVMLAASFFSLISPGIDHADQDLDLGRFGGALLVLAAVLAGAAALLALDRAIPHEHFVAGRHGPQGAKMRRIGLFILAITLHNLPEGLAVGVGFGGGEGARSEGTALAVAIGLQNAPESLSVAVALVSLGYRPLAALAIAAATGLVEALGGLFGAGVVAAASVMLPIGLGFAAGAMLFVISHEIIPETHRSGHEKLATSGLMVGLVVMTLLDTALG